MKIPNQNITLQIEKLELQSLSESAKKEIEALMIKEKWKKILEVHEYALPQKEDYEQKGRARTRVKTEDGIKQIWAKSEQEMLDKLYDFYFPSLVTVKEVFESAVAQKQSNEPVSEKTLTEYYNTFNRFFDEEFQNAEIKKIDEDYLKSYTKQLVCDENGSPKKPQVKETAFLAYKGVLNIIFGYAASKSVKLINENPVDAINNAIYIKMCSPKTKQEAKEKALQPDDIQKILEEVNIRMSSNRYHGYYVYGYMILTAIETGMRAGELCALKWEDIDKDIWIHSQLLEHKSPLSYEVVNWTKNEKKHEGVGRHFPLTQELVNILTTLKETQKELGIQSKYVFCTADRNFATTRHYEEAFANVCKKLNLAKTNNHSIRMYFNSYVLIPAGIQVADRAKLLGHSVETNLKRYTFESATYAEDALNALNKMYQAEKGEVIYKK